MAHHFNNQTLQMAQTRQQSNVSSSRSHLCAFDCLTFEAIRSSWLLQFGSQFDAVDGWRLKSFEAFGCRRCEPFEAMWMFKCWSIWRIWLLKFGDICSSEMTVETVKVEPVEALTPMQFDTLTFEHKHMHQHTYQLTHEYIWYTKLTHTQLNSTLQTQMHTQTVNYNDIIWNTHVEDVSVVMCVCLSLWFDVVDVCYDLTLEQLNASSISKTSTVKCV